MMTETWMQIITILASNILILMTFFGISVSLHNGMREEIREMQKESKKFYNKISSLERRRR